MTKREVIKDLTDRGVFALVDSISSDLDADTDPNHAAVNKRLAYLISRVGEMREWLHFDIREMVQFVTMAYGLEDGLGMADMDLTADIEEDLRDLFEIVCDVCYPLM